MERNPDVALTNGNTNTNLLNRSKDNALQKLLLQWSPYQYYAALEKFTRKVLLRRYLHRKLRSCETESNFSSSIDSHPKTSQTGPRKRRGGTVFLYDFEKRAIALLLLVLASVYGYWRQTNQLHRFHEEWQLFKETLNDLAKEADRILQIGLVNRPSLVPDLDNGQLILFQDNSDTTGTEHFTLDTANRDRLLLAGLITEATAAAEVETQLQNIVLDLKRLRRVVDQELEPEVMAHLENHSRGSINDWLVGDPFSSQLLQAGYTALDQLFPFQLDPQLEQSLLRIVYRLTGAHEASCRLSQALKALRETISKQPNKALDSLHIQCQASESRLQLATKAMEGELGRFYNALLSLPASSTNEHLAQKTPASSHTVRTDNYQALQQLFQKHDNLYSAMLKDWPA
jgi:hypothetical protein